MALRSTLMEDIQNYRREWLWHLLREQFDDNKEKFAREANISSGLLHNNLIKRRNLGERLARRIEEKLGLTPGSLDKPIEWQERNGDRRGPQKKTKLGKLKQRVAA